MKQITVGAGKVLPCKLIFMTDKPPSKDTSSETAISSTKDGDEFIFEPTDTQAPPASTVEQTSVLSPPIQDKVQGKLVILNLCL